MKSEQLQLRVSPAEKELIRRRAEAAGMPISAWILRELFVGTSTEFQSITAQIPSNGSHAFAELNDLLSGLPKREFEAAAADPPAARLSAYQLNYVAAMVEQAAMKKKAAAPGWTGAVPPLEQPHFGSRLEGLRLHLLVSSPPPFRRRNIFIDSGIGDRV